MLPASISLHQTKEETRIDRLQRQAQGSTDPNNDDDSFIVFDDCGVDDMNADGNDEIVSNNPSSIVIYLVILQSDDLGIYIRC